MRRGTLSRAFASHPARVAGLIDRPGAVQIVPEARERVLERIRREIAAGDEAGALRIARELERRFDAAQARRAEIGRRAAGRQG